ncbi:MAG: 3-deoxy-8-phosphooctulonate synthase [Bacteriovoracaceae bacterium]|nr:3-deoxy-8-phosphooctulonate synthase [Bacteriovoracaceae bacterium]
MTPFFIGPCVLESEALVREVAEVLVKLQSIHKNHIQVYFKGSFDKANRSGYDSYRGPGLEAGLKMLEMVKKEYQLPTITDVHEENQLLAAAEVVDVLQIPAFLCRQTDLVVGAAQACAKHKRLLNVKKGQFLSPWEVKNIVEKVTPILNKHQIYITERGSSFGYNYLVVDMTSFAVVQELGVKVIFDATHSAQRPGSLGKSTGGARPAIPRLARAAVAAGCDGLFMEAHPNPSKALSDSTTQLPLQHIVQLVGELVELKLWSEQHPFLALEQ